jgi:hypothetical protein
MRFQKTITSITFNFFLSVLVFICGSLHGLAANSLSNKTSETDAVAQQLLDKFADGDKKGVLVMDSQPSFGEPNSFGPWLADQLASSLASQGQTLTLIDRSRIGTGLEALHLAPKDDWTIKNAVALGKSLGASILILPYLLVIVVLYEIFAIAIQLITLAARTRRELLEEFLHPLVEILNVLVRVVGEPVGGTPSPQEFFRFRVEQVDSQCAVLVRVRRRAESAESPPAPASLYGHDRNVAA